MSKPLRNITLVSVLLITLSSCGMLWAGLILSSYKAKLTINDNFIESSHGLINGVQFEKLTVLNKDEKGIPTDFIVTQRFACYNSGAEGTQKHSPKKLYFDKVNGYYKWVVDTVNFHYKRKGNYREIIGSDTIENTVKHYGFGDTMARKINWYSKEKYILKTTSFATCPVDFECKSWYYVNFHDPALASVYLYVESKSQFYLYKFGSGVSPI